jgi:hypothetical protein
VEIQVPVEMLEMAVVILQQAQEVMAVLEFLPD